MFRWWLHNVPEKMQRKFAWMLPHGVVKWAYIRVGVHATTGKYSNTNVTELGMMEALNRW